MDCCQLLEWDSAFFGLPVARLQSHYLTEDLARRCLDWCRRHSVRCLYFLANLDDTETATLAAKYGFRLVDIRVTLDHGLLGSSRPVPGVRLCREADLDELRVIASQSHQDSRFYFDGHFGRDRCDALYVTWLERSFRGYADAVLVAELDGKPAGYVTCHLSEEVIGSIGLLGVAPGARGRGLGGELVEAALAYFRDRGMKRVTVVTQGRNVAAQRLYQKHGFLTAAVQLWFHRWFDAPEGEWAP